MRVQLFLISKQLNLMSLNLIRTLLNMAKSDGSISGSEMALIHKIAVAKEIPMFEVELMANKDTTEELALDQLSNDEKFEYIYTIILMTKMDGRLDSRELETCSQYAKAMGFSIEVVPKLLEMVKSDHELVVNKDAMKNEVLGYLN